MIDRNFITTTIRDQMRILEEWRIKPREVFISQAIYDALLSEPYLKGGCTNRCSHCAVDPPQIYGLTIKIYEGKIHNFIFVV